MKVQIIPEEIAQGDAVLIKIFCEEPLKGIQGKWHGKTFDFYEVKDGRVFSSLLGIDLDVFPGSNTMMLNIIEADGSTALEQVPFTIMSRDFPLQRLTLPSKMVFLSAEDLARVRREKATVDRIWALPAREKMWRKSFIMPVQGPVLSPFGVRRIINDAPRSPHTGIDLRAKAGTPVFASSEGVIVMTSEHFFSGKSVFIDHGMGIVTMYFHLSEINVRVGEEVAQGKIIGLVGQTGRASGPHLHWGVRAQGSRIDPLSLVRLFREE